MNDFSPKDLLHGRFLRRFMGIEPSGAELAPTVEDLALPAHMARDPSPRAALSPSLPKTRPTRRPKLIAAEDPSRVHHGETWAAAEAKTGTDAEPR